MALYYGVVFNVGDTIGIALDMDGGSLTFYVNGVSQGVAYGVGITGTMYPAVSIISGGTPGQVTANFGASAFAYPVPSGYTPYDGSAPTAFDLVSPANGATGQSQEGTLRWNESDNADSYDVYLDTNNPPTTKVSADQSDTSYSYIGLSQSTTYYWKVVAKNDLESVPCNNIFSFTTVTPGAPGAFALYYPPNGAQCQPVTGTLTWGQSLNATGYDVYLGTSNPPTNKVSSNQAATSYGYGTGTPLSQNTTYYWKVTALSPGGSADCNTIFSFKTYASTPGSGKIMAFASGATYRPYIYLSKRFKYRKTAFTCGKVLAETYPVTLNIIYPDPLTVTIVVTNDQPFRLPTWLTEEVDIQISGTGTVYAVFLAGALEELPA